MFAGLERKMCAKRVGVLLTPLKIILRKRLVAWTTDKPIPKTQQNFTTGDPGTGDADCSGETLTEGICRGTTYQALSHIRDINSELARSKIKTYALLALAMLLFAGLAWSLNLTAFNVWVAGGPPVQHREIYEHRANIFLVVSNGFLAAFLLVLWGLIRNRKRQTPEE